MALNFASLLKVIAPKKAGKRGGLASTGTFNPQNPTQSLTVPQYRDHLTDIFSTRQANDSRELLKGLFKTDPDVSAAVFSYLTLANTDPIILARDLEGNVDPEATRQLHQAVNLITRQLDYTLGFQMKKSLKTLCEELRYMELLRGGIAAELILNDSLAPSDLRVVDLTSVTWYEKKPGEYKPVQKVAGSDKEINLDIPTFFVKFFRRDPTEIYTYSIFVSSINTIAARQQVINDLYRIMRRTGYPRMDIKVIEEVMTKNAPAATQADPAKLRTWLNDRMGEIASSMTSLSPDDAMIHWDSVDVGIINDKMPAMSVDISNVIDTLNAQNQAALKTMSTVIGRGEGGVNTGSVEARIAAMNADEINDPIAELLSSVFSFILHQNGFQGFAEVKFKKAELRPETELEPQLTLRAQRLRQDLSDGLISDIEYALWLYNRLPPEGAPELAGTGFMTPVQQDPESPSPNSDPLGRGQTGEGGAGAQKMTKSKAVKK